MTAALAARPEAVEELVLSEGSEGNAALQEKAVAANITVRTIPRRELDLLLRDSRHQGVAARCPPPATRGDSWLAALLAEGGDPLLLVLDGVLDPHNLGACLRSADAAGAKAVIVPRSRTAPLSPLCCKAASGAAESVPLVAAANLVRSLETLKEAGLWLVGAEAEATEDFRQLEMGSGGLVLVLGGEGRGLRQLTRQRCDLLGRLPMAGQVPNLNVSVAVGICLFEAAHQRQANSAQRLSPST